MRIIHRFTKWLSLALTIIFITGMIVGISIEKEYDGIIGGYLNTEAQAAEQQQPTSPGAEDLTVGGKLCKELLEEGMVLLKNDKLASGENSLPLPMSKRRVNIFGYGATDQGWLQFGIGSGSTPPQAQKSINLLAAFDNSAYSYNTEIFEAYKSLNWSARLLGNSKDTKKAAVYNQYEASRSWYESQGNLLDRARYFSDTAIYVITRVSGENTRTNTTTKESVPAEQTLFTDGATTGVRTTERTYLQTSTVEEGVLDMLHENFKNVIVILNTTNAMFLDTMDERVQSVLYAGITGETGAAAIPEILWGEVNPSGHLSDTFPLVPKADPAFANRNDYSKIVFQEGIYFGYKWYETADKEGFWSSDFAKNNFGINSYEQAVYRPFGYGLSYTTFDWELKSVKIDDQEVAGGDTFNKDSKISLEVDVTNTGSKEGKEVVQLYYTAPYTAGKIEKASTNLLDFEKTLSLKPNETQTLKLSFIPYDMASFDTYDANQNGFKGYELDSGVYTFELKTDAHTVKNSDLSFTLESGNIQFANDPKTNTQVKPLFSGDDAYMGLSIDGKGFLGNNGEGVKYLSRADFANTFALAKTGNTVTANVDKANAAASSSAKNYYNFTTLPKSGVEANLRLVTKEDGSYATFEELSGKANATLKLNEELISELGSDYESEKWDALLDQMSYNEMCNLVYYGGYGTYPAASIGKVQTLDLDGPAGFNFAYAKNVPGADPEWTSYPSETMIACTFSKRLAYNFGLSLGRESKGEKVSVNSLYGPGANLHRSPFGSRNYEYFSEDRVLTGKMAANEILGAKTNGLYMLLKHFICDEMGYNPRATDTWLTEQALREEYGRPFEIAVKEGGANGVMSSFNDLGNIYVGHNYALCTTMLRDEWGFRGMIATDYFTGNDETMYATKCVYAGNDMMLNPNTSYPSKRKLNTSDPIDMHCARQAAKNILYTYTSTYYFALTNEPLDPTYGADLSIKAAKTLESAIPGILTTITVVGGVILAALTVFLFLRPVVKGADGKLYMTEMEQKIRKQIWTYLPLAFCLIGIVLSLVARGVVKNSFFINFFTGVFTDLASAFTSFGFGVVMNVVIYASLLLTVATIALSVWRLLKDRSLATIILTVSSVLTIFLTTMFLGVLLFTFSTTIWLKSVIDLFYMLLVGGFTVAALVIVIIQNIKYFTVKKQTTEKGD